MAAKTILVVAGDPSGDLHGSHLVAALKSLGRDTRVAVVGGPLMRQKADEFIEDLASRGLTGFLAPLKSLPFFLRLAARLKRFMRERKPAAIVCIDYYGFNRRVLGLAKACGVPAYYYISPQVWATRPGRARVLSGLVRRMFVIFPFEKKIYDEAGLPCDFVGHPLVDYLPVPASNGSLTPPLKVGLLPGSRASEVKRHLPLFVKAFGLLRRQFPAAQATVFASPALPDSAYAAAQGLQVVRESDYRARAALDIAISSSGTATLENALLGIPMVVVYKLAWPTYLIARALIKVPYIAMVNILAGRRLVPELIQREASPAKIARAATAILENPRKLAVLKQDLIGLRAGLGPPGAARRTAQGILREVGTPLSC